MKDNAKMVVDHLGVFRFKNIERHQKQLSQIILDNTDCADMIPPDSRGLFYTNDRVLFKAYYAEDSCLQ